MVSASPFVLHTAVYTSTTLLGKWSALVVLLLQGQIPPHQNLPGPGGSLVSIKQEQNNQLKAPACRIFICVPENFLMEGLACGNSKPQECRKGTECTSFVISSTRAAARA